MSYNCYISFKQLESSEVYPFFQKFKKITLERMDKIAESECFYCPFIKNTFELPEEFSEITKKEKQEAVDWAIKHVFNKRYFYNEDLKLLGIYGVTPSLRDLFDQTVCFQNSCDQNYDRKTWEGITIFTDIYDKWINVPESEIIQKWNNDNPGLNFEKEFEDNIEKYMLYYRQSYCYDEIWSMFENTLFNDNDVVYLSLFGPYETQNMKKFVKLCYEKYREWEKKF